MTVRTHMAPGHEVSPISAALQIQSYCPAYQPKFTPQQGLPAVKKMLQAATVATAQQDQMAPGHELSPIPAALQIQSYCPGYQPKCTPQQGLPPVKKTLQAATVEAAQQDQVQSVGQCEPQPEHSAGLQPDTVFADSPQRQGNTAEVPQSCAQLPLGLAEVPQGCTPVPNKAAAGIPAEFARRLAYLAGVLHERRRQKDPSVEMHIDKAWKQVQMLLKGKFYFHCMIFLHFSLTLVVLQVMVTVGGANLC